MKIRLEPDKTSLRISKSEFEQLLSIEHLRSKTTFPNGQVMTFLVSLANEQSLMFDNNQIIIELPNTKIRNYTPAKVGLSFYFQLNNSNIHELLFEVDIKKKPLGFNRQTQS